MILNSIIDILNPLKIYYKSGESKIKQENKISLEIPLFLIFFLTVGIIEAVWFSNSMSNDLKRDDLKYIIKSCKKK